MEHTLRILIANKYVRITGGADLHCLDLARALRDKGHDVAFLSTADSHNIEHHGAFIAPTVTHTTRSTLSSVKAGQVALSAIWN